MYYIIILILIAIDQAVKYVVRMNMQLGQTIPVVQDVFHITYIQNTGAAFSIMQGQTAILIAIPSIITIAIIVYIYKFTKKSHFTLPLALALVCGGGLGNLTDRIRFGAVVDFIDFRVFPIFNFADIFVCVGCGLLIIHMFVYDKPKTNIYNIDDADNSEGIDSTNGADNTKGAVS